jgi:hypothetical protein
MKPELGRLKLSLKTGDEPFISEGLQTGCTLLEFWRWSVSDLISNATRGRLAEFIVAKALGISTSTPRDEWAAYDLVTPAGVKVEVKSAAYLQSWAHKDYSAIRFGTPKTRAWDPDSNQLAPDVKHQADVYVFALLAHKNKSTLDPMNLDQWVFYVLPTTALSARTRSQQSISLATLETLSGPPEKYDRLASRVDQIFHAAPLISPVEVHCPGS